jgi:two-component system, NtrC family, response regulator HydG
MPESILIVEDEVVVRYQLAQMLRDHGYEVTEAADGAEAIEFLTKQTFNLIISDFMLPRLYGFDLVNVVGSQSPNTPLIVISGYLSETHGQEVLEGMADFIHKPIDPDLLLARVQRFLQYRQLST